MNRNWAKIGQVKNWYLRLALATADDKLSAQLATAFPECFSGEEAQGPVPWSVLLEKAKELKGDSESGIAIFMSDAAEELGLPVLGARTNSTEGSEDYQLLTKDDPMFDYQPKMGEVFERHGQKMVSIYTCDPFTEFVPLSCVDMTK